jgi:hypothetical protein
MIALLRVPGGQFFAAAGRIEPDGAGHKEAGGPEPFNLRSGRYERREIEQLR